MGAAEAIEATVEVATERGLDHKAVTKAQVVTKTLTTWAERLVKEQESGAEAGLTMEIRGSNALAIEADAEAGTKRRMTRMTPSQVMEELQDKAIRNPSSCLTIRMTSLTILD